jgi:hypothetical protein
MLKVVVENERTKKAQGRKMANGKGGQRGATEEGNWPQRVRTKGNGRRRHWQRPVSRKMTSKQQKNDLQTTRNDKIGSKLTKLVKTSKTPTFKHTVQNCTNM